MADDSLDQVAFNARNELRRSLDARPPDVRRLTQRARARRRALAGVAAALVMVTVAVPLALRDGGEGTQITTGPSPDGSNADLLGAGEFRPLARAPLAGRSTMAAVWTGRHMFTWGGDGPNGQFDDGATYDPRSDAWTLLPSSPLTARNAPAAVWTGEEVILWGGASRSGDGRDGAAYDPATRRWRSIAEAPFASAGRPVGLWTGSEMIVLAGFNSRDAGAYDPATDSWRALPDLPGQLQAPNPVGAWADGEVFAVIQSTGPALDGPPSLVSLRLDSGNAWSSEGDLPSGQAVLAWTGDALLVAAHSESFTVVGGDRRAIAVAPDGVAVGDTPSVWNGTELVLWEGDTASAIDPDARTWRAIPAGDSSPRTQPALVWADGVLLAWGGFPDHAAGVMLRPPPHAGQGPTSSSPPTTSSEGEAAVWDIDSDASPSGASESFRAMVTRLGCSGGETGEVLDPTVVAEADRIVVTFTVEPLPGGDCPSNNQVPYVVQLDGPVGQRELVDGACLSGEAASTSFCSEGAVRWSP